VITREGLDDFLVVTRRAEQTRQLSAMLYGLIKTMRQKD